MTGRSLLPCFADAVGTLEHGKAPANSRSLVPDMCATGDRPWHPGKALEIRCHQLRPLEDPEDGHAAVGELNRHFGGRAGQGTRRTCQSGEVARRDHPCGCPRRVRAEHFAMRQGRGSAFEIVRKILGRHEIATVQTTAVDQEQQSRSRFQPCWHIPLGSGLRRTGRSAPSAMPLPPWMRTRMTYARRYALFTLRSGCRRG